LFRDSIDTIYVIMLPTYPVWIEEEDDGDCEEIHSSSNVVKDDGMIKILIEPCMSAIIKLITSPFISRMLFNFMQGSLVVNEPKESLLLICHIIGNFKLYEIGYDRHLCICIIGQVI